MLTLQDSSSSKTFSVPISGAVVGREGTDLDIIIPEAAISKRHARIFCDAQGRWWLEDLGSLNGTYVEGKRLNDRFGLNEGTNFSLANHQFSVLSISQSTFDPNKTEVALRPPPGFRPEDATLATGGQSALPNNPGSPAAPRYQAPQPAGMAPPQSPSPGRYAQPAGGPQAAAPRFQAAPAASPNPRFVSSPPPAASPAAGRFQAPGPAAAPNYAPQQASSAAAPAPAPAPALGRFQAPPAPSANQGEDSAPENTASAPASHRPMPAPGRRPTNMRAPRIVDEQATSSIMSELAKAIPHYMVTVPKLLFNPLGTIRRSIEDQQFPGLNGLPLLGWALPGMAINAGIGLLFSIIAAIIVAATGGGFAFGSLIVGIIVTVVGGIVGGLLIAFLFHPIMAFFIKLFRGESDERSRTNYFIIAQSAGILCAVPSALSTLAATCAALIPVHAVGVLLAVVPLLLSIGTILIAMAVTYFWYRFFNVHKIVQLIILILGALGALFSLISVVRLAISAFG